MTNSTDSKFISLLREQVKQEFTASQQYIAIAVYFDNEDLPQLAKHFYAQANEEHNHAMMIVQYFLDRDMRVDIPGVEPVRNDFTNVLQPLELALDQEREVTDQIVKLASTARDEGDYVGEQFMQWFLKEQVEEVATMTTLLAIAKRAGDNLFDLETFVDREVSPVARDSTAPHAAGGAI
ncbi:ferritin [Hoyosella subflava]|uniref:Ferritin n=1 Tax=Hoyosella subflava (strain DSM 45089 / JCM 17490 / NBRC 109087 / DQS3-9A1) TaxID=443218 RepID=F6ERL8_HOYSD|nr:ferritin [Hoyosella subflava]AEF38538.1 putative bacterioferritin BfrB [Hoyosella subflava DQS3-9A1]